MEDLKIEDQMNEIEYDNGWSENIQDKFESYLRICNNKSMQHSAAQSYFSKWYRWTTYPLLIMGGVNAVIASLNASDGEDGLSLIIAILSGVYATSNAIVSFVEYGKRSDAHNLTANNYAALARSMEAQIWLKPVERDTPKFNFEVVSRDFNSIASTEPAVPNSVSKSVMSMV